MSIVLAVVLVALAGNVARAQLVLVGLGEMSNAGTNVQTIITNNMAAALEEKRLESFMKQLAALHEGMKQYQASIDATEKNADAVMKQLVAMHDDKNRANWEPERRALFEQALAQKAEAQKARKSFKALSAESKELGGHSSLRNAKTFAKNSSWYRDRLRKMAERLGGMTGVVRGPVPVKPGPGPAPAPTSAGASLRLVHDSKEVWFEVNGVMLKSGDKLKLSTGQLTIRALAMTEIRSFIKNKKPTANTTIHTQDDYTFHFTVANAGDTLRKVTKETYVWSVLGDAPAHKLSTSKADNDTVTWTAPALKRALGHAIKAFTFNVSGDMTWSYERGTVKKTEPESFHGSLTINVDPT
ncbi:MAG: hypothetical protein IT370_08670 [Deltaproteobacteria bacterium]|nr:hypothetical protein [Deltaproteobacteria bacterium]